MNDIKTTAESFTNFYYARVDDVATRTDLKPLYVRPCTLSIPSY